MKKVGMIPDNAARPPILTADEQLAGLMEIIRQQSQTIEELRNTISELNASLAWLKKKVFGKMSEKCKPIDGDPMLPFEDGGLMLIETEIEEARKKAEAQILAPRPQAAVTTRRNRIVMDDLPVVTVIINPEGFDLDNYVKIGEEHTRTLEMKPGYLYVKDTVAPPTRSGTAGMRRKREKKRL